MCELTKGKNRYVHLNTDDTNKRLDIVISEKFSDISRSRAQNLILSGDISIDQVDNLKSSYRIKGDEKIRVSIPEPTTISIKPEPIPLEIIFEDKDLIVVFKPRGMVVHPGAGNEEKTLVHAVLHHCNDLSGIGGKLRPGIVHRLDKVTSGAIIIAKNDSTHISLAKQFASRAIQKKYLAIILGTPEWSHLSVDAPLMRHPVHRKKIAVRDDGRQAVTRFERLTHTEHITVVAAFPKTGRTHQIRVHLKHAGYGILGDILYSPGQLKRIKDLNLRNAVRDLNGICLHAYEISFCHPRTQETVNCTAQIPVDFKSIIDLAGTCCLI